LKIKSHQDFWSGLMFIATGIGFAIGATNYSMGSSARPGPGYFPLILSVIMALLGCVVLFKSLTIETEDGQPVGQIAWRPLLVITASIVVFGLALPRLGMFATIPLLILMVSFAGGGFSWKDWLGTSIVLTLGSWVIFIYGLNLTIPLKPAFMG
jgi:Tripartite tricarboxylate transporter TctB family